MESGTLSDGLFFFEAEFGKTATDTVVRNIIRLLFLNGFLPFKWFARCYSPYSWGAIIFYYYV